MYFLMKVNQQQVYLVYSKSSLIAFPIQKLNNFSVFHFSPTQETFSNRINALLNKMGSYIFKKVTPQEVCNQNKFSIINGSQKSEISRANFRFLQQLTVTGYNQQQVVWIGQNIRLSSQLFLIKQVNKATLYDNNRTTTALTQLQMWLQAYHDRHIASMFLADLRFAFQDYQYLYMVYDKIDGYTLDTVFKHHVFTQQQTKYVVAVLIQLMEFFHERNHALTQLSPEHLIVQKTTGKIKLLQIFNPMPIDQPYHYNNITNPSIYSAPQVLAKNKVLAESDYYTLGTMMYEMMTHKNIMQQEHSSLEIIERHHIMVQEIEIKKYNLPEGWNPEAADFLVKLLIKNPLYRLGRYGSFQLRFHPWLQNYNWEILPTRTGISLNEQHFRKHQVKSFPKGTNIAEGPWVKTLLHDPLFLRFFQKYTYKKRISTSRDSVQIGSDKSCLKSKGKRSEKYYDKKRQESDISDQEEDDYCEDLDIQSEQIGKSQQESKQSITKTGGKGLLNIVEKGY